MSEVLRKVQVLADATRFAVFECIRGCAVNCEDGVCTFADGDEGLAAICDVRCQVHCAPSTMTHHLNALREAGLIETERRGRNLFARIVPGALAELAQHFDPIRHPGGASSCGCASPTQPMEVGSQ
ncbi:MAG: helix-turn-helix transcriptional regulator [Fimbriimonadaceae bacterium]|nr:helix-turn-helix transcriptional regulator [Fimbriimonadaceae bacterium]